MIGVKIQLQD